MFVTALAAHRQDLIRADDGHIVLLFYMVSLGIFNVVTDGDVWCACWDISLAEVTGLSHRWGNVIWLLMWFLIIDVCRDIPLFSLLNNTAKKGSLV